VDHGNLEFSAERFQKWRVNPRATQPRRIGGLLPYSLCYVLQPGGVCGPLGSQGRGGKYVTSQGIDDGVQPFFCLLFCSPSSATGPRDRCRRLVVVPLPRCACRDELLRRSLPRIAHPLHPRPLPQSCAANIVASSARQMTSGLTGFGTQRTFACRDGISPVSNAVMKTNGM
jgi:hypothetical protein